MKIVLLGLVFGLLLWTAQGAQCCAVAPADVSDQQLRDFILHDNAQAMASYLNDHPDAINTKEIDQEPFLLRAIKDGSSETVSLLLMRGADHRIIEDGSWRNLWHFLTYPSHDDVKIPGVLAIARDLIKYPDLDINKRDVVNLSSIQMAKFNHPLVRFLLDHKADAKPQDDQKRDCSIS